MRILNKFLIYFQKIVSQQILQMEDKEDDIIEYLQMEDTDKEELLMWDIIQKMVGQEGRVKEGRMARSS